MKSQKGLVVLATLSLLGLSVSCADKYAEGLADGKTAGYATGYDEGYDDGLADGDEQGFARAQVYFASADYNKGFTDGKAQGITIGYNNGFSAGKTEGTTIGYNSGVAAGKVQGYDLGYDDGELDGYDMGYDDGKLDGYDLGYDDGNLDGYDMGYDDGHWDGAHGLSVGKTKKLQGYANILSMAHNEMFDYSKIKAPSQNARGVVANGKFLFEETSLTNKDTLKRAAVVEQYLVAQMAQQVNAKFGLEAGRALKVAKAANHLRKYSSKQALTNADTDAYLSEIVGSGIKTIESAVEAGDFKTIIDAAAAKNGLDSVQMAELLTKNFI